MSYKHLQKLHDEHEEFVNKEMYELRNHAYQIQQRIKNKFDSLGISEDDSQKLYDDAMADICVDISEALVGGLWSKINNVMINNKMYIDNDYWGECDCEKCQPVK